MEQITIKVPSSTMESLETVAEEQYDGNRSQAIRDLLNDGLEAEELRRENERLQRQLRAVNSRQEDVEEIVEYIEGERELQRRELQRRQEREQAPIWRRWRWAIFGRNVDD